MRKGIIEVESFSENEISKNGKVVLKFFATWCGPCNMMAPIVQELSEEMEDIKFFDLNIEKNEELVKTLGIKSLPTIVLFEDGVKIKESVGFQPKEKMRKLLEVK